MGASTTAAWKTRSRSRANPRSRELSGRASSSCRACGSIRSDKPRITARQFRLRTSSGIIEKTPEVVSLPKFVFVTGGVTSSLGKGITAASLGRILAARGLAVASLKMDPYLNVDPGTMSPYQHGEVFVTEDGAETDLDLGHYERFIDRNVTRASNLTTAQTYDPATAQAPPS